MTITQNRNGTAATLSLGGRLDTLTAPEFEAAVQGISDAQSLEIDCAALEYISSAGLRVLLTAHKAFAKKGGMAVLNVGDTIMDIFEVTGFKDILSIR